MKHLLEDKVKALSRQRENAVGKKDKKATERLDRQIKKMQHANSKVAKQTEEGKLDGEQIELHMRQLRS